MPGLEGLPQRTLSRGVKKPATRPCECPCKQDTWGSPRNCRCSFGLFSSPWAIRSADRRAVGRLMEKGDDSRADARHDWPSAGP